MLVHQINNCKVSPLREWSSLEHAICSLFKHFSKIPSVPVNYRSPCSPELLVSFLDVMSKPGLCFWHMDVILTKTPWARPVFIPEDGTWVPCWSPLISVSYRSQVEHSNRLQVSEQIPWPVRLCFQQMPLETEDWKQRYFLLFKSICVQVSPPQKSHWRSPLLKMHPGHLEPLYVSKTNCNCWLLIRNYCMSQWPREWVKTEPKGDRLVPFPSRREVSLFLCVLFHWQVRDSAQSFLTVHVPLYVSYIYVTAPRGWASLEHHTEMEFSFFYDTVLWRTGMPMDVLSSIMIN